jgi:aryl-alcohol dehydrogenase-like predicted oxidoreductase
LLQLALGFVVAHRAVTSAIIGPRTHEQLEEQLGAADVRLTDDVLDRIDELVPAGRNVNPDDVGWSPPAVQDPLLRRRVPR